MWNAEYVDAAQAAVEKHDPGKLYAMMRAEIPIPAFLLPVIAGLSEPKGRRPAAFTALEDRVIGQHFDFGEAPTDGVRGRKSDCRSTQGGR